MIENWTIPIRDSWGRDRLVEQLKITKDAAYHYKRMAEGIPSTDFENYVSGLEKNCKELQEQNGILLKKIGTLELELARAKKDSSNSSLSPSSDITKPPRQRRSSKRKIGGQPGHPRWSRKPFPKDQIDKRHNYKLTSCPCCKGSIAKSDHKDEVFQQIEKVAKPYIVSEHRAPVYWCEDCKTHVWKKIPESIQKLGLFGPRLSAEIGFLKGEGHLSYTTLQSYLKDVYDIGVSRGFLVKVIKRVSAGLADPVTNLEQRLWSEPYLNIDETGHKENGHPYWTWCFRAKDYAYFSVVATRSTAELIRVLTLEFKGVIGSDYYGAYRKFARLAGVTVQYCWAHMIRNIKFLLTLKEESVTKYAENLLQEIRRLFRGIHQTKNSNTKKFRIVCKKAQARILKAAQKNVPKHPAAQTISERFLNSGDSYFIFIDHPQIGATNNTAEQTIRFVVIDRYITQGTRSAAGRLWCSRIWSTLATCKIQKRSSFEFIYSALLAYMGKADPPRLLQG